MKQWRVKRFSIPVSRRRRLLFSVRRFYAPASRRSQKYQQWVIDLDLGPFKEVAIRSVIRRPRRNRPRAIQPTFWRLSTSIPLVMIALGLSGSGYFGSQLVSAHALTSTSFDSTVPSAKGLSSKALAYSIPTHISIPSVGIDADMITVGKNADGTLQTPPLFDWTAGWYKYSPTPGQVGPAIITGHVDTYKGISVFWRLREVKRGDLIHITRSDGSVAIFKITTLAQYDQNNFPTKIVYGNINYPGIRLITCGGAFDTSTGHYTQNTVVSGFLDTED